LPDLCRSRHGRFSSSIGKMMDGQKLLALFAGHDRDRF
jgi:hypothetical protein